MTVSWPSTLSPFIAYSLRRKFKRPADALEFTEQELADTLDISISSARDAQLSIARQIIPEPVSVRDMLASTRRLSSSLFSLDTLLGGGFEESWLVELVGEAGAGKTQLCLTLCAKALLGGSEVFWLDTENTFRPDRLIDLLGCQQNVLNRIHVRRCASLSELVDACVDLSAIINENNQLPLVVIDSVAAATIGHSASLIDRNEAIHRIARMSKTWKAVTVVTNHLRARMRENGPSSQAALGNTWAHDVTCRIVMHVEESLEKRRWLEVVKAPTVAELGNARVDFSITKEGVQEIF